MHRTRWLPLTLALVLPACGSTTVGGGGRDAAVDSAIPLPDGDTVDRPDSAISVGDAPTPPDAQPTFDVQTPDDATVTKDVTVVDDLILPGPDAPPPDDVTPPDDVAPPVDGPIVEDIPIIRVDVPVSDVVVPADAPASCAGGVTDRCPATYPGPCVNLNDGASHTITFRGLGGELPATCEGTRTSTGPDGVVPLTLTAPSDIVITGAPTGGDAVVLALTSATDCGSMRGELACSNSSAAMTGGMATLRLSSVPAGNYFVQVSTAAGNPALVQAMVSPARPRTRGDVCPGVAITPDGAPVVLNTMGFTTDPDYGTTCGTTGAGTVDAVFSYTLTEARDVTVNVSATGAGDVSVDVETTCGTRSTAIAGCLSGNAANRVLRNQAPGTYYIVTSYRAAGTAGRNLVATVTTAAPTRPAAADACPGSMITLGAAATTVPVAALTPGATAPACLMASRADACFSLAPLGRGDDLLVNVSAEGATGNVAMQLQAPCGTNAPMTTCEGGTSGSVWHRYRGLGTSTAYTVAAATTQTVGNLGVRAYRVPAATPVAVTGNAACMGARTIPATGGVFTGSTAGMGIPMAGPMLSCSAACRGTGRAAYYRLDLTERQRVVASTEGSRFDTILAVQSGATCPGAAVTNACNDDAIGQSSVVDVTLNPGTYWIIVTSCGLLPSGDYTLDVSTIAP